MKLELAAAYWTLGLLQGETLPKTAAEALSNGLDSDSLRILAGEKNTTLRDHESLFQRCLTENGIRKITPDEAGSNIAQHRAKQIVNGTVTPYEGAAAIVSEVCHSLEAPDPTLSVFLGLESEYADFSDDVRLKYYGEAHCQKVRDSLAEEIVVEAVKLLEKDDEKP